MCDMLIKTIRTENQLNEVIASPKNSFDKRGEVIALPKNFFDKMGVIVIVRGSHYTASYNERGVIFCGYSLYGVIRGFEPRIAAVKVKHDNHYTISPHNHYTISPQRRGDSTPYFYCQIFRFCGKPTIELLSYDSKMLEGMTGNFRTPKKFWKG